MENHSEIKSSDPPKKKADTMDTQKAKDEKLNENLKEVRHIFVVMSGKGGVGKSTVAANLAFSFSKKGARVGLLDCDIHGPTIPKLLGIEDERPSPAEKGISPVTVPPGLKVMSMGFLVGSRDSPVIWRGPLKMGAIRQFLEEVNWGSLDYLIIDLPPGTGDEPLSVAQLLPRTDGAVIVTTPQEVALLSVRKSVNFAKALNMRVIGIVENMSGFTCPHCGKEITIFKPGGGTELSLQMDIPFLGRIPLDPHITETGEEGKPIGESKTGSEKAFERIVNNIEEELGEKARDDK